MLLPNKKRSLNDTIRRKEQSKIALENHVMLSRLQGKQSEYSVARWETAESDRKKMLKNICEYPSVIEFPPVMVIALNTLENVLTSL